MMWARVKGKTENALLRLQFRGVYNLRPGMMRPIYEQRNTAMVRKPGIALASFINIFWKGMLIDLQYVERAMVACVTLQTQKHVLEATEIKRLAKDKRAGG